MINYSGIKPSIVRFKNTSGPVYHGAKNENGRFVNEYRYDDMEPWSKVLGVISACEGRHDTVVMYDGTGVTFGFMQWTMKSGRLQKLLSNLGKDNNGINLLGKYLLDPENIQLFRRFGFEIKGGCFCVDGKKLNPSIKAQQDLIVSTCMGNGNIHALGLCALFAALGAEAEIQDACVRYAIEELNNEYGYNRPPLKDVGGKISCLIPRSLDFGPVDAIFWNLFQNSPGGTFTLFKKVLKIALDKNIVIFDKLTGYSVIGSENDLLNVLWENLVASSYSHWGLRSSLYQSNKKNLPRCFRIKDAIKNYYDITLPISF